MDIMRLTEGRLKAGAWNDFERTYRECMAADGQVDGLKSRWLMRDIHDPDHGWSITLWDSLQAMERYEAGPVRSVLAKLQPYFVGDYTVTKTEVHFVQAP